MSASSRPQRSVSLVRSPASDGVGIMCITDRKGSTFYTIHEFPCEIGGRGFAVHRLGLGQLYHVRIAADDDCSCECLGFLAHQHCRHILGLQALIRQGLL
jgi:hypothetical protein